MTFQQAWATIRPRLDTPITLADLEDMPAAKRRCLEEKVVDAAMQHGCAQAKWQVMVQEAAPTEGCGGVWADLLPEWAEECEEVYHNIKGWTDWMWTRVNDVDARPQVNSTGKRHSFYVIEFHRAGATQVNLSSNTRRTVRRLEVKMGFSDGQVREDPYNVFNMPYGSDRGLDAVERTMSPRDTVGGASPSTGGMAGGVAPYLLLELMGTREHHHGQD